MIYNFIYPLADIFQPFNLFRYLTFRSIAAFLTALIISFIIGGTLIRWLRSMQAHGQPIREDGPVSHILSKKGTPTMGGLLILIALTVVVFVHEFGHFWVARRLGFKVLRFSVGFGRPLVTWLGRDADRGPSHATLHGGQQPGQRVAARDQVAGRPLDQ